MAVYTHITLAEAKAHLAQYEIGALLHFEGIAQGVENTNYRVETDHGKFILTLFEKRVRREDLPFFLDVMQGFDREGISVPKPIAAKSGDVLLSLADRPAVIISFLDGRQRMTPSADDCHAMGRTLAKMHRAAEKIDLRRKNDFSVEGWVALVSKCEEKADTCLPDLSKHIRTELQWLEQHWPSNLPEGIVHADLFPDNVFFEATDVSGIIDFYFACTDSFAYDLCVCLNAWAWRENIWLDENEVAFVEGYNAIRPLSEKEQSALPVLQRGAAFRFLMTRLFDWLHQDSDAVVNVKDPLEFYRLGQYLTNRSEQSE